MSSVPKKGRKTVYSSREELVEARNARQKQRRQLKKAQTRQSQPYQTFVLAPAPANDSEKPCDPVFLPNDDAVQMDDDLDDPLPLEALVHAESLGSASMDISDSELCEPGQVVSSEPEFEPVLEDEPDFVDIDDLGPEIERDDHEGENTQRQATRLITQLIQFQGCCADCHRDADQEYDDGHETYSSLQEIVDQYADAIPGYPDMLETGQITRHEDDLVNLMTATQKRWLFTGLRSDNTSEVPDQVYLQKGENPSQTSRVSWDIDSIIGFATSLAVAKGGILWNSVQRPISDLQSSGHLARLRVHYTDSHGHPHHVLMPANKVPHYTFGRTTGLDPVSIYFLFPGLFRENQQSSQLLESDYQSLQDQVILPAIYQNSHSSQAQHYPGSFQQAKHNSTARGIEGRSQKISAGARVQLLQHPIQPEQLHRIWKTIEDLVEQPGLTQFKGITILLAAKNLKLITQATTWTGMISKLQRYWGNIANEAYCADQFYFDIGKETCPSQFSLHNKNIRDQPPAETLLWKKCCLETCFAWCQDGDQSSSTKTTYPVAMLRDSISMGVEYGARSKQRASGLIYSQFYPSIKEVFAAGDQYPYANTAIETLALDEKLRRTWTQVGQGQSHHPTALLKAYLHCKDRCYYGFQASQQKSFGTREEHRVSRTLFRAMDCHMRALDMHNQKEWPSIERPYVTLLTTTALSWMHWNINKFCLGFEMVYSLSRKHWVTWEHTRVMLMFLRCLRCSYGHGHPKLSAGCWRDVNETPHSASPNGLRRTEGLGFQVTIDRYGYCWFLDKVDWDTLTFRIPHGQYMLFNNPSMQLAYRARYGQIRDVRIDLIRVDKIYQLMQEFDESPECQTFLTSVLLQICLCAFRKDVFQHIKELIQPRFVEEALAGEVPLCWPSINRVLRGPYRPLQLVSGTRIGIQSADVLFSWLWGWKDDIQRKGWSEKPYRLLFRRCSEIIRLVHGKDSARAWQQDLRQAFIQSHWIVPYPQGNRFMKWNNHRHKFTWWSSYHAGVAQYYESATGQTQCQPPLPAHHIAHYPQDGWKLSANPTQYMPYEQEPPHQLSDLSDSEIYDQVLQIAADKQLQGGNVCSVDSTAELEPFYIDVSLSRSTRSHVEGSGVIGQMRQELRTEKIRYRELQYGRGSERQSLCEAEQAEGTESSDDEQLDRLARKQGRIVEHKSAQLREAIHRAAIERQEERRVAQEAKRRRQTQRAAERLARAPAFVLIEEEEAEDSDDSGIDVEDGKEAAGWGKGQG